MDITLLRRTCTPRVKGGEWDEEQRRSFFIMSMHTGLSALAKSLLNPHDVVQFVALEMTKTNLHVNIVIPAIEHGVRHVKLEGSNYPLQPEIYLGLSPFCIV